MPRALMTPGREDLSPWPPVGQLPFEQITALNEEQLDRAFKERHGLSEIFKNQTTKLRQKPYARETQAGRRVEIKRIVLARLEGNSMGEKSKVADWSDRVYSQTLDPERSLQVSLSRILTDECKKRIEEVRDAAAREAMLDVLPLNLQKIERDINAALLAKKLPPLTIREIFNPDNIPAHQSGIGNGIKYGIEEFLRIFLMELQGYSESEIARRIGTTTNTLSSVKSKHFSNEARAAIQAVKRPRSSNLRP